MHRRVWVVVFEQHLGRASEEQRQRSEGEGERAAVARRKSRWGMEL